MVVAHVADDDAPKAWAVPRKLLAWRKHEEQAAAARRASPEPGMETKAQAEMGALPTPMAAERRESEGSKPKLRLEGAGNVVVLTKQPSGELLVSLYSSMPDQTARILTAAAQ